jgi:hypothetical protein
VNVADDLAQWSPVFSGLFEILLFVLVACILPFVVPRLLGGQEQAEPRQVRPSLLSTPWRNNRPQADTRRWTTAAAEQVARKRGVTG